jgi:hypothetical protein
MGQVHLTFRETKSEQILNLMEYGQVVGSCLPPIMPFPKFFRKISLKVTKKAMPTEHCLYYC